MLYISRRPQDLAPPERDQLLATPAGKPQQQLYELKCWQLALLTALFASSAIDLRYGDESGFSLTPCVPYGWPPKGRQTAIRSEHKRVANVFGLMSQDLCCYLTQGNINSDFIIEAIDDFAKTVTRPTVIVLDTATWHVSKKVRAKADEWEQQGGFLFYRPTYSPPQPD